MFRLFSASTPVAHIVGPGKLKIRNRWLHYSTEDVASLRIDPRKLRCLFCYGGVSLSDMAIQTLLKNNVEVTFLDKRGRDCLGRLITDHTDSTELRLRQLRGFDSPELKLQLARELVQQKIASQQDAARHAQRHGATTAASILKRLKEARAGAGKAMSTASLRGIEGAASSAWFDLFRAKLQPPWSFPGRIRRPPRDPVNSLLSLGATLLTNRAAVAIQSHGLELNLGFYHEHRPGRPSLACDLVEPLRVLAVDRWVLAVCNHRMFTPDDFEQQPDGALHVPKDRFGEVIQNWEANWQRNSLEKLLEDSLTRLRRELGKIS